MCVSYLITGWQEGRGGLATFHDEIGSGLSAARVKGGGGKLSIIAMHWDYNVSPTPGSGHKPNN